MVGVPGQVVQWIGTPEGRLAVEVRGPAGPAPTVVFLHGLSAHRSSWTPVVRNLEADVRCVLIDLLGRGESDAAPGARYDLESEARRLLVVLEALDVRRPLLAGHSHGAAIAVAAAGRCGAGGLLLVNPVTPDLPRPALLASLRSRAIRRIATPALRHFRRPLTRYILVRRVFADPASMPSGAVDRYSAPWGDPSRAAGLVRILADWRPAELELWDRAPGIPVHVIAGSLDRRIPREAARRWAERLGGELRVEIGCGHAVPEERPEAVASVVKEMLRTAGLEERRIDTS